MIKKWMWMAPVSIVATAGITGGIVGAYFANQSANPYRFYAANPMSGNTTDLIQSYFASAVNGTKMLLLPGFNHTSPMTQALAITQKENEPVYKYMSKTGFTLLDDSYGMPIFDKDGFLDTSTAQPLWTSQVASMQFRTDLGSFIVGIAAAEFLNEYQYYFAPNDNDDLTWATYGGATFSSVTGYMGGLQRGIAFFNEYIAPYATTKDGKPFKKIKQVFLNENTSGNFASGFGPTDGNELIRSFLEKNVDLLVPVAGPQTQQAVRLIKQFGKKTVVLGVDSAAEDDTNSNLELPILGTQEVNGSTKIGGTNKIIQFSSMKKLDQASKLLLDNIENGDNGAPKAKDSTIGGFGYQSLGTTQNGSVGSSEAGYQYFVRAIGLLQAAHQSSNRNNTNGSKISVEETNKIFAIPNNNPETNIPGTSAYKDYWDKAYEKAIKAIEKTKYFQDLNEPSNKIYYTLPAGTVLVDLNDVANAKKWDYSDISNEGKEMMPLYEDKLLPWFIKYYTNGESDQSKWTQIQKNEYSSLQQWFKDNKQEIEKRRDFELTNQLNKEAYEHNKSVIKIILTSSSTPLLDKSFGQSTYVGLVEYWRGQGVDLPMPPS